MYSIEEFIIAVYRCVEDELQKLTQAQPIRSRGFEPGLSDAEVLAMEIVGEYQNYDSDKGIWSYFRRHWHSWFPSCPVAQRLCGKRQIYGSTNIGCSNGWQQHWARLRRTCI